MHFFYPLTFLAYALYSFVHTDPNILYFNHPLFIQLQELLWRFGHENRTASSITYAAIIFFIFIAYLIYIKQIDQKKVSQKKINRSLFASIMILILSNPALSHDLFNYIFNARMVIVHHTNPHIKTAWDFTHDSWTRFVQNAHSTAPYGYGWTGLSLIPYSLGLGRLKTTILAFKLFGLGFFTLLIYMQKKLQAVFNTKNKNAFLLFALNPLVLIETFSNGHNDVIMMSLLLSSIYLAHLYWSQKKYSLLLIPLILFGLSVSIKFASIAFLGGFVWWIFSQKVGPKISFGTTNSIAHFSPLLTSRSQRFLPWYLLWSLTFLPFIKENWLKVLLIGFSFSSLLSYIPSFYYPIFDLGAFEDIIKIQKQIITFSIPTLLMFGYLANKLIKKNKNY